MFRKSGNRFCEKNMFEQRDRSEIRFNWNGFCSSIRSYTRSCYCVDQEVAAQFRGELDQLFARLSRSSSPTPTEEKAND